MQSPDESRLIVQTTQGLRGTTTVPGDKSISHRAVILGALAQGKSQVRGWLAAGDTEATLRSVQALGIHIERPAADELYINGTGALRAPKAPLDFANAGTGIRLMAGVMGGTVIRQRAGWQRPVAPPTDESHHHAAATDGRGH